MKLLFKFFLKHYLKTITKLVLFIRRPVVIAVAGSVNKYFVKEEVKSVLIKEGRTVRANPKSFNTEIGLPLAILNLRSGYNSYLKWLPILLSAPLTVFKKDFPDYLVLELGISKPKDMQYLLKIVKPEISIITNITQRYLESFKNIDNLMGEYQLLMNKTAKNGLVILNNDNSRIKDLKIKKDVNVKLFGFAKDSDCRVDDFNKNTNGQEIEIFYQNHIKNFKIKKFGKHHIYSLMIALIIQNHIKQTSKNV